MFWLFGSKKDGRRPVYSVGFQLPAILMLLVTLLLPLVSFLRNLLR